MTCELDEPVHPAAREEAFLAAGDAAGLGSCRSKSPAVRC